jgi:rhodanese-related sulfurtransferase
LEFIQQNLSLVALAIISGSMLLFFTIRRPGGSHSLTPTEATLLINREDAQIVDVREPDEYASGHLPESRNFPLARLEERAGEIAKSKDTPLIVVCQSGTRSEGGCKTLEKLGYTKVHNLGGGIAAWRTAGLPLKKGAKK